MIETSDEQLMGRVKNGDLDALAPLFEKYNVRLYNFFLRLTGNRTVSQDLTQSVFRRILTYRKSYNGHGKFRSWMYQIARNVQATHHQNNKLKVSDFINSEELVDETVSTLEELEYETRKKTLYEALSRLHPQEREIIELSRFQGLKYREMALITNCSESAVKVRVHRAIKKLRELYFELA